MLALIQRVLQASVSIEGQQTAQISEGLLILCGFKSTDTIDSVKQLINKCFNYRIFADQNDKMNLSLKDINGQALLVPQFTLVADTQRGLRPSFSKGMPPVEGQALFEQLKTLCQQQLYPNVAFGQFGADMQVALCNNGPVTFMLEN